jgi:DNA uptake protein ComE-like DNA-binding protein
VQETQFLYLAREFLKNPLPVNWTVLKTEDKTEFVNKENGQVQSQHPGIEFFKDLYRQIKNKKAITLDKLKAMVNKPAKGILTGKYLEGLPSFFAPDENIFYTQRLMLNDKLQSALDKMKNISTAQLKKITEEREKVFNVGGEEYRRANEVLNSELIRNFNKLKK